MTKKWCICPHGAQRADDATPGLIFCKRCENVAIWIPVKGLTPEQAEQLALDEERIMGIARERTALVPPSDIIRSK